MESKIYMIFSVQELPKIDFSVICEQSQYTVRKSIDGTKTFIKWNEGTQPWFLDLLETKEGPYTLEEISDILLTEEWAPKSPALP
jgi:hypothetical protein